MRTLVVHLFALSIFSAAAVRVNLEGEVSLKLNATNAEELALEEEEVSLKLNATNAEELALDEEEEDFDEDFDENSLVDADDDMSLDVDESGVPGCCYRDCCSGRPRRRQRCRRQANMCHARGRRGRRGRRGSTVVHVVNPPPIYHPVVVPPVVVPPVGGVGYGGVPVGGVGYGGVPVGGVGYGVGGYGANQAPAAFCPPGWVQRGAHGADIGGCGLTGCEQRYGIGSPGLCAQRCASDFRCHSFSFAPMNGDRNHPGVTACTIYSRHNPTGIWTGTQGIPTQVFCVRQFR